MAIFLTDDEKRKFKDMLKVVMSKQELREQFDAAMARKATEAGDHQSAVLGLYAGLISEIQQEYRDMTRMPRVGTPGPTLEALKKKQPKPPGK